MSIKNGMNFNGYMIDGWICSCGEIFYNPGQAQRILLEIDLKKEKIRTKLGKIRSNLILRLPKDVERVLYLKKGDCVQIKIEDRGFKVETDVRK